MNKDVHAIYEAYSHEEEWFSLIKPGSESIVQYVLNNCRNWNSLHPAQKELLVDKFYKNNPDFPIEQVPRRYVQDKSTGYRGKHINAMWIKEFVYRFDDLYKHFIVKERSKKENPDDSHLYDL